MNQEPAFARSFHFVGSEAEALQGIGGAANWLEALAVATGDNAAVVSHVEKAPELLGYANARDELIEFAAFCFGRHFGDSVPGLREKEAMWKRGRASELSVVYPEAWKQVCSVRGEIVRQRATRATCQIRNSYLNAVGNDTSVVGNPQVPLLREQYKFDERCAMERYDEEETRVMRMALDTFLSNKLPFGHL